MTLVIDIEDLSGPDADAWQLLCSAAEEAFDADPQRYEQDWLPRVVPRLASWPTGLRRCPERWFRTRREPVASLLRLGAVGPADLGARPPEYFTDGDSSVSSVSPPTGWTVFTDTDLEFIVEDDIAGGDAGRPDPVTLQVAGFVLDRWPELEAAAEAILAEVGAGWDDPYCCWPAPQDRPRFESGGLVTIAAVPAGFTVHCDDHCHGVNGWPYGFWLVDFAWGVPVGVRVGTYQDNIPCWPPTGR